MPGGRFRPIFPAACAAVLAALTSFAPSASAGQGAASARGGGFGPGLGVFARVRPFAGPRVGIPNAPASFGPVLDAPGGFRGSRSALGRGALGYGYGGYGAGLLGPLWGAEGAPLGFDAPGLVQPMVPERPASLGIAPSPVQPPALYVIGQPRSPARVQRETLSRPDDRPSVMAGLRDRRGDGGAVAPPLFIRVPSPR